MEDGKALAKDVLPFVAARLKDAANANGALELALKGLNVKLAQSTAGLQIFQESLFDEGIRGGLSYILDGFNDLMKASKPLSKFLGGLFKGAVIGLVAPFRLVYAAIYDLVNKLPQGGKDFFNDMLKGVTLVTGGIVGLGLAVWGVKKAFQALKGVKGLVGLGGKSPSAGGKGGSGLLGQLGVQKVFVTNMPIGGLGGGGGITPTEQTTKKGIGKFVQALNMIPIFVMAADRLAPEFNTGGKHIAGRTDFKVPTFMDAITNPFGDVNRKASNASMRQPPQTVKVEVELKSETLEKISEDTDYKINQSYNGTYY